MIPEVKLGETENARRVGNSRDPARPRTIIVEFCYASIAMRVYQNRMQLARARKAIFISEFLTKENAYLFYVARQNRGEGLPIAKTWTWRGQVYVARTRNARGTLVRSLSELKTFITMTQPQPPVYGPAMQQNGPMDH